MEQKIEVGEYIRTKDGKIGVIGFPDDEDEENMFKQRQFEWYSNGKSYDLIKENEIIKHSKNIIDLIEEGDVIVLKDNKKYEVLKISWSKSKGNHIHIINPLRMQGGIDIFADDIKSIVTKEQFKSVEYEV